MDDTAARLGQDLIHPATWAASQSPAACIVRVGQACGCILVIAAAIFFPHPLREHAVSILQESHTRSRHPEAFLPELD
ncbi:hypothetical protein VTO73DRAFT_11468 [Trametes versicolor]